MNAKMTSVYVPVKTPETKAMALILSIFIHAIIGALVIFFHHENPPPPMETMLISPDQLAEIEGQIKANQQQNSGGSVATQSQSEKPREIDPKVKQMKDDINRKEAQWRKQQALFAEQLDKEMRAEQQAFIDELDREENERLDALKEFRNAENSVDEIRENIRKTSEAYKKDLNESKEKPQQIESVELGKSDQKSDSASESTSKRSGGGSAGGATDYKRLIVGIIDGNWSPPTNSSGKRLTASFNISPTGTISNIQVSGGDDAFKNSLIQAVQKSSPLPPPPSEVYESFSHNNFTFVAD